MSNPTPTYADAFVAALAQQGATVSADQVADSSAVDADVQNARDWLGTLDDTTRQAIDEVTADNQIKVGLADPSVGIVQSIGPVLSAIDTTNTSISISAAMDMIATASQQAAAAAQQTPGN